MPQPRECRNSAASRRLLLLVDEMGGGTGEHIVSLISRWQGSGWEVRVVCPSVPTTRTAPDARVDCFPRQKWLRRYPFAQMRRMLWLLRYVREFKPDVVHAYFFWSIIYGRVLKRMGRVRTLVENREDQGFNWGTHEYVLLRATRGIPDEVICVSEAVRQVVIARERLDLASRARDPQRDHMPCAVRGSPVARSPRTGARCQSPCCRNGGEFQPARQRGEAPRGSHSVGGPSQCRLRGSLWSGEGNEIDELKRNAENLGVSKHLIFAGFRKNISRFLRCHGRLCVDLALRGTVDCRPGVDEPWPAGRRYGGGGESRSRGRWSDGLPCAAEGSAGFRLASSRVAARSRSCDGGWEKPDADESRSTFGWTRRRRSTWKSTSASASRCQCHVPWILVLYSTRGVAAPMNNRSPSAVLHILAPAPVGGLETVVQMLASRPACRRASGACGSDSRLGKKQTSLWLATFSRLGSM